MDAATVQIVADIIKTVGFPVAVSAYVLWRLDGLILNVLALVNQLVLLLKSHCTDALERAGMVKELIGRTEDLQDQNQSILTLQRESVDLIMRQSEENKKLQDRVEDLQAKNRELIIRLSVRGLEK